MENELVMETVKEETTDIMETGETGIETVESTSNGAGVVIGIGVALVVGVAAVAAAKYKGSKLEAKINAKRAAKLVKAGYEVYNNQVMDVEDFDDEDNYEDSTEESDE